MSWKTTVCGLLGLLGATIMQFFPEYSKLGLALTSFATGAGLIFARDNNKTSEDVGATSRAEPSPRIGRPGGIGTITAVLLAAFLLSGCATPPKPEQLAGYIADARDIAELGTTAVLIEKPAFRHELELARDSLAALEALPPGNVTIDDLLLALTKLPLDQLQSDKGRIYVMGGRIVVRRFVSWAADPQVDVGASGAVQQFAAAIRKGMDAALTAPARAVLLPNPALPAATPTPPLPPAATPTPPLPK